jgi:hypothetical protein
MDGDDPVRWASALLSEIAGMPGDAGVPALVAKADPFFATPFASAMQRRRSALDDVLIVGGGPQASPPLSSSTAASAARCNDSRKLR